MFTKFCSIIDIESIKLDFCFLKRGLMQFQHVDPQEAVEIHEDVQSNFSLGIHWGTFNLSYEVSSILLI